MVVCLDNAADRCCGIGHQLGWLYSEGDYLLLLDGDMELEPGFLDTAVEFTETHPGTRESPAASRWMMPLTMSSNRASSACI